VGGGELFTPSKIIIYQSVSPISIPASSSSCLSTNVLQYIMKMKNSNISLTIKDFNMSLWQVKKRKWMPKICLSCQKIKKMAGYNFFLF